MENFLIIVFLILKKRASASVVDIGVGFRGEILNSDYWPSENEAVDFEHIPLAKWYTAVGRKARYSGHSILSLLNLPRSNGLIVDVDHLLKNLVEQIDSGMLDPKKEKLSKKDRDFLETRRLMFNVSDEKKLNPRKTTARSKTDCISSCGGLRSIGG